jgi:predicted DNA-binding transcriptional regulator YafY
MSGPTGRLLSVLAALQSRPFWSGPELAARLDVTVRTVRRDIDRLRQLGYQVDSEPGANGGYRLGVGGSAVPPLMLDTDEAFALAVLVRAAEGQSLGDAAQRAVAKLEQMLPSQLRRDVALTTSVIPVQPSVDDVDSAILRVVSAACRDAEQLAVDYRDRNGRVTERRLLPYRVVSIGRRWYLVAQDARLPEWRTWRVDRILSADPTGHRFTVVDPPDAVELVQRSISTSPYRHQAKVELHAPVEVIAARVPPSVAVLEALDERTTMLTTGAESLDAIAFHIGMLDVDFRVIEPDALRGRMDQLAARLVGNIEGDRGVGAGVNEREGVDDE